MAIIVEEGRLNFSGCNHVFKLTTEFLDTYLEILKKDEDLEKLHIIPCHCERCNELFRIEIIK